MLSSFVTWQGFFPFPLVTNGIFAPEKIPCVQWMCLNNLIQSLDFPALAVIKKKFHSLLWRDIKKLPETRELVAGCDSFIPGADIASLLDSSLLASLSSPPPSASHEHFTGQSEGVGGFNNFLLLCNQSFSTPLVCFSS